MRKEIYVLIGPAAIGKTTYLKEVGFPPLDTKFMSRDDIVDRLTDKYGYTYDELFIFPPSNATLGSIIPGFEKYGEVIETPLVAKHICPVSYSIINSVNSEVYNTYYEEFENAIKNPDIQYITLDKVHMSKKERTIYFPYLKNNRSDFYVTAVLFNFQDPDTIDVISKLSEIRRKRIEQTGKFKTIPIEVQQGMIDRYEEVTLAEGFDSILKVDTLPKLRKLF